MYKKPASRRMVCALLGFGLLIGGCGFSPVYSQNGSGVGPVNIAPIEGRTGYFLEQELKQYTVLEKQDSTPRNLKIKLTRDFSNIALGEDSFYKRIKINYSVEYVLEAGVNTQEIKGAFTDSIAFSGSSNPYSEVSLQKDAEQKAAKEIADRIWRELMIKTNATKP
jgi:LPS-assembly lipoprotein